MTRMQRVAKFNDSNRAKDGVELLGRCLPLSEAALTFMRPLVWIGTMPKLVPISSKEDVGGKIGADWDRKGAISCVIRGVIA